MEYHIHNFMVIERVFKCHDCGRRYIDAAGISRDRTGQNVGNNKILWKN